MSYRTTSKVINNWCMKNSEKVDEAYMEKCDGQMTYWIHLKDGWIIPEMECGTVHESTVNDAMCLLRTVVKTVEWEASETERLKG